MSIKLIFWFGNWYILLDVMAIEKAQRAKINARENVVLCRCTAVR